MLASLLVVSCAAAAAAAAGGHELHVCAARGDDAAHGTAEQPLRTLGAGRDAARRLNRDNSDKEKEWVSIVLHGTATHFLAAPLLLDQRDR